MSPADVVALELAVEGGAADAEHLAGHGLVAFHLLEHALDGGPFDVFEIIGRQHILSDPFRRFPCMGEAEAMVGGRSPMSMVRRVAQRHCPLDAVLQFAHVSRPVILQQAFHRRSW